MAESEIVRAALKAILEDPLFQGTPLRSKKALNEVKKVLHSLQEHSSEFEIFAVSVMGALEKALGGATTCEERTNPTGSTCRAPTIQCQKLWLNFHSIWSTRLISIWTTFLSSIKENLSSVIQRVNQKLYEGLISRSLPPLSNSSQPQSRSILSEDELNIVRYAAGYVPHELLKKHNKSDSVKSANFAECFIKMAVSGDETNLLLYTETWTNLINRGNLFEISDSTFLFFQ